MHTIKTLDRQHVKRTIADSNPVKNRSSETESEIGVRMYYVCQF